MQEIAKLQALLDQPEKAEHLQKELDGLGNSMCSQLFRATQCLLQDKSMSISWQNSAGQICQDIAWEKLHTGDWKNVTMVWRDMYSFTCLVAAMLHLRHAGTAEKWSQLHAQGSDSTTATAAPTTGADSSSLQSTIAPAMHELDMAAIMGGPMFRPEVDQLIAALQALHEQHVEAAAAAAAAAGDTPAAKRQKRCHTADAETADAEHRQRNQAPSVHSSQAPSTSSCVSKRVSVSAFTEAGAAGEPELHAQQSLTHTCCQLPPGSLQAAGKKVPSEELPSLERFLVQYMLAPDKGKPVIVTGAMSSWPALSKWQDLDYLSRVAGPRTVPVELGKHYLADGWGQQLMLFSDFVKLHVKQEAAKAAADATSDLAADSQSSSPHSMAAAAPTQHKRADADSQQNGHGAYRSRDTASDQGDTDRLVASANGGKAFSHGANSSSDQRALPPVVKGYLAQHPLFDQIPALRNDIQEPAYCALGEGQMQSINAWFGPAGTVTPLHHDPHNNLLAQVVGTKYVRLYHPQDSASLYPYQTGLTQNSSQVDVDIPDLEEHPDFAKLTVTECVLQPGQMLFIPPGWWHYVKALSVSFSVSFWWR